MNLPVDTGSIYTSALITALSGASSRFSQSAKRVQKSLSSEPDDSSLEHQLYDSLANCKLETASVAMHLDDEWRKRFFSQLDNLLDIDEWDPEDLPVTKPSFVTLLRLLLLLHPSRRPGLGIANDGTIIASWTIDRNRLTIECFPNDQLRFIVNWYIDDEHEIAAGNTSLERIDDVLAPYQPQQWFAV